METANVRCRATAIAVLNGVRRAWDKARAAGEDVYFATMLEEAIDDVAEDDPVAPGAIWNAIAQDALWWNLVEAYAIRGCPAAYETRAD